MDTRDSLQVGLLRLGIKAKLAQSFHPEQSFGAGKSLGLIEVDLGPIRWINVRKVNEDGTEVLRADLAVPDMRLRKFPQVDSISIHSVSGKAPAARWLGDDLGLGILEALNRDPSLQAELPPVSKVVPDLFSAWSEHRRLEVRACTDQHFWTISLPIETREPAVLGIFGGRRLRVPQPSELAGYEQIGRVLLASRLSNVWESGEPVTA